MICFTETDIIFGEPVSGFSAETTVLVLHETKRMILGGDLTREASTLSPASLRFILSTPLLQLQEIVLSSFSSSRYRFLVFRYGASVSPRSSSSSCVVISISSATEYRTTGPT